jgi:16S rRNA (guanine966-N2)-methyltransferase
LRIIAGELRGRALSAPGGQTTRPTADRARQAAFNMLEHAAWSNGVRGARVIDLFAGSGALGLEAISRGATFCLFVDTDEAARGAIRRNIETLDLFGVTRLHRRDATDLGPRPASAGPPFDLAFLDPPYAKGLGERALTELVAHGWLADGAVVMLEQGTGEPAPRAEGFETTEVRDYGAARLHFLRYPGQTQIVTPDGAQRA